jgi:hypothetical protein
VGQLDVNWGNLFGGITPLWDWGDLWGADEGLLRDVMVTGEGFPLMVLSAYYRGHKSY